MGEKFIKISASDLEDNTILYKTKVDGVDALISKSVSEMKSLLGLPSDYVYLLASLTNVNNSMFIENLTEIYNESGVSVAIDRASTGEYSLTWSSDFANFSANEAIIKIIPSYSTRVNHLPSGYELNYVLSNDSVEIQFYNSGVLADLPIADSINLYIEVVRI